MSLNPIGSPSIRRDVAADRDRVEQLLLGTSRTFALSIPMLPQPTREEVAVAYLLFRVADTLEDATLWAEDRRRKELERFAAQFTETRINEIDPLARQWRTDPQQ